MMSGFRTNNPTVFTMSSLERISGGALLQNDFREKEICGVASLTLARSTDISFFHHKKYLTAFKQSQAGACITAPGYENAAPENMAILIHPNPYKAYALIMQAFHPEIPTGHYRSPTAYIAKTAVLGQDCHIEHGAYIGEHVTIGDRCKIGVNSYIGDGVHMGNDCIIENNASICHAEIGNKLRVYPGARIGQDGFGFASDANGHYKIPHLGKVIIGDDVSIGANSCIDRGSVSNTIIEECCRIDNLVQIGHNVKIGKGSILCAQVGIAGSTVIGKFVTFAGKAGAINNISIGDGATVLGGSIAMNTIDAGARVGGHPAIEAKSWLRQAVFLKKQTQSK